jgi:succinate dehydrogenase / fumarate reductase cytochrome b subunit
MRPRFLNLAQIRLPVTAGASIAHRATGLLLAVGSPLAIYLLDLSLSDPDRLRALAGGFRDSPLRVLVAVPVWVLAHHLLAGLRIMALDLGLGERREVARASAWGALGAGVAAGVLAGAWAL